MKLVLIGFLVILALNALVILGVAAILFVDHWKAQRKLRKGQKEAKHDAHAEVS